MVRVGEDMGTGNTPHWALYNQNMAIHPEDAGEVECTMCNLLKGLLDIFLYGSLFCLGKGVNLRWSGNRKQLYVTIVGVLWWQASGSGLLKTSWNSVMADPGLSMDMDATSTVNGAYRIIQVGKRNAKFKSGVMVGDIACRLIMAGRSYSLFEWVILKIGSKQRQTRCRRAWDSLGHSTFNFSFKNI